MRLLVFGFLVLLPLAAGAHATSLSVSGYTKYLTSVSKYPGIADTLYDQRVHTRINTSWKPAGSPLRAEMDVRLQAVYGDSVAQVPDYIDQVRSEYALTDLDAELWNGGSTLGIAQIDRLWLDYSTSKLEVTLGRQRIAWGTALVWNVIDLFNPKSVLDFDYEEKPGADALRLQYYTGAISRVEMAAKPGATRDQATVAGLYTTNIHNYDLYGLAGVRDQRWLVGGAWAGSVLEGGFRGEVLVGEGPDEDPRDAMGGSAFAADHPVVSLVLSADYTFANTFYIHTEVLYNSNGKTDNAGLYFQEAQDAGMLSAARWSLYQEFAYDLTPLTRATIYAIYNPLDHSRVVVPMLTHSLTTNLDLLVIGQFATGEKNGEFADYGNSVTLRLKYSF